MSLRNISLRQIRYFVAAAELQNISKAAAQLFISQSAITEAIKSLERETGVRLVDRAHTGIRLTVEGTELLKHAYRILATVNEAFHSFGSSRDPLAGELTIAATYIVSGYFLAKPLARFKEKYHNINVQLVEYEAEALEAAVLSGAADLAILALLRSPLDPRTHVTTLIRSPRVVWTSANHPFAARDSVTLEEIAREPYIILNHKDAEEISMEIFAEAGLRPQIAYRTAAVEGLRSMVAAGLGVSVLSEVMFRPWSLEGQRMHAIEIAGLEAKYMNLGLFTRRDEMSPASEAFRAFLVHEFTSGLGQALTES